MRAACRRRDGGCTAGATGSSDATLTGADRRRGRSASVGSHRVSDATTAVAPRRRRIGLVSTANAAPGPWGRAVAKSVLRPGLVEGRSLPRGRPSRRTRVRRRTTSTCSRRRSGSPYCRAARARSLGARPGRRTAAASCSSATNRQREAGSTVARRSRQTTSQLTREDGSNGEAGRRQCRHGHRTAPRSRIRTIARPIAGRQAKALPGSARTDAASSDLRPFSALNPSWSPDGKQIVF